MATVRLLESSKKNMEKIKVMNIPINDFGYWETKNNTGHLFDPQLCNAIVNLLKKNNISSVYDLGCGEAKYTQIILNNNIDCLAYDGNPNTPKITNGLGSVLNLAEIIDLPKVDCVLSLEVGEHIPKRYEQIFINNLCKLTSKILILSWAIIGQKGTGHVNCQDNYYIIEQIENNGLSYDDKETIALRESVQRLYFKNTIMVFNNI